MADRPGHRTLIADQSLDRLRIDPVTPDRQGDLGDLFRGTDAATCWDMVPRTTAAQERQRIAGWKESGTSVREGRRSCFAELAAGSRAPGLIAYLADRPVGWISVSPRSDYPRVAMSRATPPVDDANVWIIPCLLVRREHRRQGITRALIEAAAQYAAAQGADALEAYPRSDEDRPSASSAFFGTVGLFRKAGFEVVRAPLDGLPKAWVRRFTVRRATPTQDEAEVVCARHAVAMAYDPTIYEGAAEHYRQGRPPYSPQLESVLEGELRLDGSGRLLDVGCGPGVLTVRLAPLFEESVGLDPDAAMLVEGQRAAAERAVTNVRWVQAVAEDLPAAAPGPYRLVTFGQSFHWTDEARVAEAVYDMLEAPAALALIVHRVDGRPRPLSPGPPPIPHDAIEALVQKYLGSNQRAGRGTGPSRAHRFEDVLVRTRFGSPQLIFVPGVADLVRDTESVLAGYFSFSSSAPHLFGDRVEDFAADLRELLASRSAEGLFWDWPGDTEVIVARRQG